jgi:hypothetical protein
MKTQKDAPQFVSLTVYIKAIALAGALAVAAGGHASDIWNGPSTAFYHTDENGLQDQITGDVALTRSSSGGGLYNAVQESGAAPGASPQGTLWAQGTLANYDTLSYGPCPLEAGNFPPGYVGQTFVVHLTSDDIYLQLTLTNWGGAGGDGDKTFGYIRSTPATVVPPPTVSITNPAAGTILAAPANLKLSANAATGSGTVTNVQFFANGNLLGTATAAPFDLTSGSLPAGAYSLTAVATAAGIDATSAVVEVTVVDPVAVKLVGATITGGQFSFGYSANAGLTYVIQSSTNLVNWVSLATNTASTNPALFSDLPGRAGVKFYRVFRRPNQ